MKVLPQCDLDVNVNGEDLFYNCILKKGHKGKHQIHVYEYTLLLQDLSDFKLISPNKFLKKVQELRKLLK